MNARPPWTNYFLLGLLGVVMVDALEFVRTLRANNGIMPKRYRRPCFTLRTKSKRLSLH